MAETPAPTLETELLSGIYSEDEKSEILREIEQAASATHLKSSTAVEAFRPLKKGILFPVVINALAVVLIVGAWFGAEAFFKNRQEGLKLKTSQLFSTEATLLAKVLEDSKAQLEAKNAEIGKIQENLDKMAQEKNTLVAQFDTQLSAKENALKADLAAQLDAEKKRLQASGISQTEITQRLSEFEAQKNAEFNKNLDAYKKQAQADIDAKTSELNAMQSKLQSSLAEQDKLKADYEKKSQDREKDLQGQLSSQGASLDKLTKEREELNLFFRQADAQFAAVKTALEAGDFAKAQTSVGLLKTVLAAGSASTTDSVRLRSQADSNIASALERSVALLVEASKKTDADPRFEAFKAQVKKAQAITTPEEKVAAVTKALSGVPEIDTAFQILLAWDAQKALADLNDKLQAAESARQTDVAALNDTLAQRESELAALQTSLEGKNAGLEGTVAQLQAQVTDLGQQIDALTAYKQKWTALADEYKADKDKALAALLNPSNPDFAAAKTLFLKAFQTDAGQELFPAYAGALDTLLGTKGPTTLVKPADPVPIRNQAFSDVLLFTNYLQGSSQGSAKEAQAASEKLARTDAQYKEVVDSIQKLAQSGAKESLVKTNKYQLFGSILSRNGAKLVIEPLTNAKPVVGQGVEIRRGSNKGEAVLGQGSISVVGAKKTEATLTTPDASTASAGDTVYLILN